MSFPFQFQNIPYYAYKENDSTQITNTFISLVDTELWRYQIMRHGIAESGKPVQILKRLIKRHSREHLSKIGLCLLKV